MLPYEIELIDKLLKERKLEFLKCKRIYKSKYSTVLTILNLSIWEKEEFKHLLTSNIWNSNPDNIQAIVNIFSNLDEEQKKNFYTSSNT